MASDSYGQGVPYLDYTDKPDLFVLGKGIVDALTQRSVMRFANAASRDVTITAPVAGMVVWLTGVKALMVYDGIGWITPAEPPQVQTYNTSVSVPDSLSVYTALNLGAQISGNWPTSMWSASSPTRLVMPTPGTYAVDGVILWQGALGSADGRAEFRVNGSASGSSTARFTTMHGSSGNAASVAGGVLIATNPGDYAEVFANQHAGGAVTVSVAAGLHRISTAIA